MSSRSSINTNDSEINNLMSSSLEREKTIVQVLDDLNKITRECRLVKMGLKRIVRKGK